jgi:hypothetical protein
MVAMVHSYFMVILRPFFVVHGISSDQLDDQLDGQSGRVPKVE